MADTVEVERLLLALPGMSRERARSIATRVADRVAEALDGLGLDVRMEAVRVTLDARTPSADDGALVRAIANAIVAQVEALARGASREARYG